MHSKISIHKFDSVEDIIKPHLYYVFDPIHKRQNFACGLLRLHC